MTDSAGSIVLPRSFLYVPGTRPELFAKAAAGPADAVVLDLEDAVPLHLKAEARSAVRRWLEGGSGAGAEQWVRVNGEAIGEDLDMVVQPGLAGLFLAKASLPTVAEVTERLDTLETTRGLPAHSVRMVGLLESARALVDLASLAAAPRMTTFGIGEVDLLADLRMSRSEGSAVAVSALRTQVVVHAAAAGLAAPVAPTSTDFRDLAAFRESSRLMHDLGFRSRTAIHPAQVPVIHEVLTPSTDVVAAARSAIQRFEAAGGGVTTDEHGRLIDVAVVREARETLARAHRNRAG
jgi:citrate lyase subunit beta/citryl-CoA lyase